MQDLSGRTYASVEKTKTGDTVQVDNDFTCIKANEKLIIQEDNEGLFIPCFHGKHYLDGQKSDDETYYIGIYDVR